METHEIKEALKSKGLNYSIVADALGVSPQHVSRVASRRHLSYRVAKALAKSLGKDITEVFPDVPDYESPPVPKKKERAAKVAAVRRVIAA